MQQNWPLIVIFFRFTPLTAPNAHKVLAIETPIERLNTSQTNGNSLFIYI